MQNKVWKDKKQTDLIELARLTLLNILSVQGVIYTHYKNKQLKGKNDKKYISNI
tara:strand:+ start:39 stop:200 length:162 start_codon:yes stop_codon:yes gene_type:complete